MDLTFLSNYFVPVIIGICLCLGYGIKQVNFISNKWIPIILMLIGLLLNVWLQHGISPEIILSGMLSGLASTGLHQAFKQLIERKEDTDNEQIWY